MKMKNSLKKNQVLDTHIMTILGLMVLVMVCMAFIKPGNFFAFQNAKSMIYQFPEYGILSFGMMICMIAGGIDLSLVGIMNFTGVIAAMIVKKCATPEAGTLTVALTILGACLVAIILGALCGAFNGFIIAYFNIPAMLVTLCGLQLYTGLAYGITGGPAINGMHNAYKSIANGNIGGIPYVLFIFIAVLLLVRFMMKSTVFGQEIYFFRKQCNSSQIQRYECFQSNCNGSYV